MTADSLQGARRADVTSMRRYTATTLWFFNVTFLATQLFLSTTRPLDARTVVLLALTVASGVAIVLVTGSLLDRRSGDEPARSLVVVLVTLSALTWVLANVGDFAGWGWSLTVSMATGVVMCLVPLRRRWAVLAGGLASLVVVRCVAVWAAGAGWGGFVGADDDGVVLLALLSCAVVVPLTYVTTLWAHDLVVRVDRAAETEAELAVARERLRFATDLHDIQGHHLQVIALKSELAERLLSLDPAAAAAEVVAIRTITQDALDDTRAVVHDYRTVTVAVEARNAASVLRSAGIDAAVRVDVDDVPPEVGTALAVAVRESVTNMLRHSAATRASVTLVVEAGDLRLTVENDGARPARLPGAGMLGRRGGTGLDGIRERVAAVGGTVAVRRDGDEFALDVRVPHDRTTRTLTGVSA